MRKGITLFRDLQGLVPWAVFDAAVTAQQGDRWVQKATCRSHFISLLLALLLERPSLRSIEWALEHRLTYLSQFGLGSVDRSTISHANEHRPWTVLIPLFEALLAAAQGVAQFGKGREAIMPLLTKVNEELSWVPEEAWNFITQF